MYPITKKTALQSERMNEVKPELERLEKKYKNKTDQQKYGYEKSRNNAFI